MSCGGKWLCSIIISERIPSSLYRMLIEIDSDAFESMSKTQTHSSQPCSAIHSEWRWIQTLYLYIGRDPFRFVQEITDISWYFHHFVRLSFPFGRIVIAVRTLVSQPHNKQTRPRSKKSTVATTKTMAKTHRMRGMSFFCLPHVIVYVARIWKPFLFCSVSLNGKNNANDRCVRRKGERESAPGRRKKRPRAFCSFVVVYVNFIIHCHKSDISQNDIVIFSIEFSISCLLTHVTGFSFLSHFANSIVWDTSKRKTHSSDFRTTCVCVCMLSTTIFREMCRIMMRQKKSTQNGNYIQFVCNNGKVSDRSFAWLFFSSLFISKNFRLFSHYFTFTVHRYHMNATSQYNVLLWMVCMALGLVSFDCNYNCFDEIVNIVAKK